MSAAFKVYAPAARLRWPARPPALLPAGLCVLVVLASLSAAQWHWVAGSVVPLVLALGWVHRRREGTSCRPVSGYRRGVLGYRGGAWVYRVPGRTYGVQLRQAWPSAFWVTLRFHETRPAGPDVFLEVTIWKPGLAPGAWQQLCMQVTQDLQFPNGGQFDRT
ncbi:MAG: hypothetical protein GX086_11185 [Alcaligenaceae bacterium]|nr:hypothetical protein [Alcaligenaceae bacterium]